MLWKIGSIVMVWGFLWGVYLEIPPKQMTPRQNKLVLLMLYGGSTLVSLGIAWNLWKYITY